jgi:hypothetical protein
VWTLPHLISGVALAYLAFMQHIEYGTAFWVALTVGIGWEVLERITRLSRTEAFTNSISDIIAAQLGFVAGWRIFMYLGDPKLATISILALCAVFGVICLFGYRAFKYYG